MMIMIICLWFVIILPLMQVKYVHEFKKKDFIYAKKC